MTTRRVDRVTQMSIARTAPDSGAFGRSGSIYGKVQNIVLPELSHEIVDYFGPIGVDRDWTGRVSLGPLTFDLLAADQAPEELGPVDLTFEATQTLGSLNRNRKFQVQGRIETAGSGSYAPSTEYPRTVTVAPHRFVIGGGADWQHLALADHGAAWTAAPLLYVDTRLGHYRTCAVNGTVIDHQSAVLAAHGITG